MIDEMVAAAHQAAEEIRSRIQTIDDDSRDLLFREARSHNGWQDRPVSDDQLRRIYDLMKMGPTSNNCCPARIRFLRSRKAKERLRLAIAEANIEKTMTAPVVAIIGHDLAYWQHLERLFPRLPEALGKRHRENASYREETAFRNGEAWE